MSKQKDPETNGLANNGTMNGGKIKFEMKLYHKPSAKELAAARPCRLFLVFTFVLFLLGFLIASIALLAITEKCNNREKLQPPVLSKMQYQIHVKSFLISGNDTQGDINGVTSKLTYIKSLGVDSILLNDVISDVDFTLPAEIGTNEDLRTFVTRAKEMGLSIFLQMNAFVVSKSGDFFRECASNVTNCHWFVMREKSKTNDWVTSSGKSAWYAFENAPRYMYYSYYGDRLPTLNLRNENVVRMIQEKMSWWLQFGVRGFVLSDVSRLTVDDRENVTEQVDQDNAASHHVLSLFHKYLRKLGAELWVVPGTSLKLTSSYLGTEKRPESHVVISDEMAMKKTIDINDLNHSISTLITSNSSSNQIGWLFDGPKYQRIASRLNDRKQAELMSLFLLTLPGHIFPYYGDERLLRDDENGRSTSHMIFDEVVEGEGFVRNDSISSETDLIYGFTKLAKLRSVDGVFTGTPKVVYAHQGVLVLFYLQSGSKPSHLVVVNFNDKERIIRDLKECGRYGEVISTVSPVETMLECAEFPVPAYGLFVAKIIY